MNRSVGFAAAMLLLLAGCLQSSMPLIEHSAFPLSAGTYQLMDWEVNEGQRVLTRRLLENGLLDTGRLDVVDGWYRYRSTSGDSVTYFKLALTDDPKLYVVMTRLPNLSTDDSARTKDIFAYAGIEIAGDLVLGHSLEATDFKNHIETSRWKGMSGWRIAGDAMVEFDELPILQKTIPEMASGRTMGTAYQPIDPAIVAMEEAIAEALRSGANAGLTVSPPEPASRRERLADECREGAGDALSCKLAGDSFASDKDGPADLLRAGQFYAWGCQGGNSDACGAALTLALIMSVQKSLSAPDQRGQGRPSQGDDDWVPRTCCVGMHDSAPPIGSKHWGNHPWWCYTDYGGTETTWCVSRSGGVWEQSIWSRCAGVEGFCDEEMM